MSTACTDVRPVLRTVFQELDYLPPLALHPQPPPAGRAEPSAGDGDHSLPRVDIWVDKYKSECQQICDREDEIKDQHAKRVAQKPLPNVFKLHPKRANKQIPKWRLDKGLLSRQDLTPGVAQNAGRDASLWVKNILNVSSCDVSAVNVTSRLPPAAQTFGLPRDTSVQSISAGVAVVAGGGAGPWREADGSAPAGGGAAPHYIVCVPAQLDFINCSVGHLYMQCIRLVNMTKFECRLSVLPPARRELNVEISGPRGLTITSGATVELLVRFIPSDVRVLRDQLVVKVSRGQICTIPIACYMQPPLLDIVIPLVRGAEDHSGGVWPASRGDTLELGARLLGDVHCTPLLLRCGAAHAHFFVLTEDAWLHWDLDCLSTRGCVVAGPFAWWPAWWRGGGAVRAVAWCGGAGPAGGAGGAGGAGTRQAALRVLSSTAMARRVWLLADVLLFDPHHLALEAQEKDFDICGEDDPGCEYYVHAGTALPHRALDATVQLHNLSPILYNYYWDQRKWGVCLCWEESKDMQMLDAESADLCFGAREARRWAHEDPESFADKSAAEQAVWVEPGRGEILPHTTRALEVRIPDVGARLGVQRTVLRLILKNIPKESFPVDYNPTIVSTTLVESTPIPGMQRWSRCVCDVVCAQLEVWWEVVPLRFVLHPPAVPLRHSRRVEAAQVELTACKLFGWERSALSWRAPPRVRAPPPLQLSAAHCATTCLALPLPALPNDYPETELITMVAANDEWKANCEITRQCETRHPALRPVFTWLGVVTPKEPMRAVFTITNDTYQPICFWSEPFRWVGENAVRPACAGQIPCRDCKERACTCALLRPARGALPPGAAAALHYSVNAPDRDGCVATLVRARRCEPDLARVHSAPAACARAALVAYRVLAPRLALRVLPCGGDACGGECALDGGAGGAAVLRPLRALALGRRACYRLRVANVTPLPTSVHFDNLCDGAELLQVTFRPNDFHLMGYTKVDVTVVLCARAVCGRRLFVARARVARAHRPLYVVVDAAVAGLEVSLQVPMGPGATTDDFVIMRRSQRSKCDKEKQPSTPAEVFTEEDSKRAFVRANKCYCPIHMQYFPPVKRPRPPRDEGEHTPIEIVTEPPSLTRVCRCFPSSKPFFPEAPESISLEFVNVPLRTVVWRRLALRNESVVTARWSAALRRWPRRHARSADADQWAGDVCPSGVVLACVPARGVLAAHACAELQLQLYADCWGVYWDQLLIQVETLSPIVIDVWMEVIGPPLQFKIQPDYRDDNLPIMWLSPADPRRALLATNVSRATLLVHAYVTRQSDYIQDVLPFRLYMRMFDVPPPTCPCVKAFDSDMVSNESSAKSYTEWDMETGVELYLAPDHGPQDSTYYTVVPEQCTIDPGQSMEWKVALEPPPAPDVAPNSTLLLRLRPLRKQGERCYRGEPPAQLVRLRHAPRHSRLALSAGEIRVNVCALQLVHGEYIRIRKTFLVGNSGNGNLNVSLKTVVPWCIVQGHKSRVQKVKCSRACRPPPPQEHRSEVVQMDLPPRSSTEVCVEVCVSTLEALPLSAAGAGEGEGEGAYAPLRRETTLLYVYDDYDVLLTLPLILELEFPVIQLQPSVVDFGVVADGDSKKTYITVSHTSPSATLSLAARVEGCPQFALWPAALRLAPGARGRLYVQYSAEWRHGPVQCAVRVRAAGAAGAWCAAGAGARAAPARDQQWRRAPRDHTDDAHLLPAAHRRYRP